MKRLIISLELAPDTTWEQVQQAIAYNTPANTSLKVGDLEQGEASYFIGTHGTWGFATTVNDFRKRDF